MKQGDRRLLLFFAGGLFILLDLVFKQLALSLWSKPVYILGKIGWAPILNPGIAFSIPLPNTLIVLLTILTLCFFAFLFAKTSDKNACLGLTLTIFGAISNLIDRLVYQNTIDYLQAYISVFNIADVLIVVGVGLYLLSLKHN